MDFSQELTIVKSELNKSVCKYLTNIQKVGRKTLETRYKNAWDELNEKIRYLTRTYILIKCDIESKDDTDLTLSFSYSLERSYDMINKTIEDFLQFPDVQKLDDCFKKIKREAGEILDAGLQEIS